MAHFDSAAERAPQLDLALLRNGPVTLFCDHAVLESACVTLASLGYHIVRLDARSWADAQAMLDGVAGVLEFPAYFGRNLDALDDCLSDVASGDYGVPAASSGLVLVLTGFNAFATVDPAAAHALVDQYAKNSRGAMLFGRRMLCLLHSDDPHLTVPPVGATSVSWNPAEWLDSARSL
jgi:hypothetical protein